RGSGSRVLHTPRRCVHRGGGGRRPRDRHGAGAEVDALIGADGAGRGCRPAGAASTAPAEAGAEVVAGAAATAAVIAAATAATVPVTGRDLPEAALAQVPGAPKTGVPATQRPTSRLRRPTGRSTARPVRPRRSTRTARARHRRRALPRAPTATGHDHPVRQTNTVLADIRSATPAERPIAGRATTVPTGSVQPPDIADVDLQYVAR